MLVVRLVCRVLNSLSYDYAYFCAGSRGGAVQALTSILDSFPSELYGNHKGEKSFVCNLIGSRLNRLVVALKLCGIGVDGVEPLVSIGGDWRA